MNNLVSIGLNYLDIIIFRHYEFDRTPLFVVHLILTT